MINKAFDDNKGNRDCIAMNGILVDDSNDLVVDVKRDENGLITQGLVVGNADYQRIRFIIEAQKGEFKAYPTLGFGIMKWLKTANPNKQQFVNEMQKELKSDGMKSAKVTVGNNLADFEVEL